MRYDEHIDEMREGSAAWTARTRLASGLRNIDADYTLERRAEICTVLTEVGSKARRLAEERSINISIPYARADGIHSASKTFQILDGDSEKSKTDHLFSYDEAISMHADELILGSYRKFEAAISARDENLDYFKRYYETRQNWGEGVKVKWGIYTAVLYVPIETLAKYGVFIERGILEPFLAFITDDNRHVAFTFKYHDLSEVKFENILDALRFARNDYLAEKIYLWEFMDSMAWRRDFSQFERQVFKVAD